MPKGVRIGGRQKGTPNKINGEVREVFRLIFAGLAPKVGKWIERTAIDNPDKAADLTLRMAQHFVARMPTEITGKDGGPVTLELGIYAPETK